MAPARGATTMRRHGKPTHSSHGSRSPIYRGTRATDSGSLPSLVTLSAAKGLTRRGQRSFPFATLRASAHALRMTAVIKLTHMGLAPAMPDCTLSFIVPFYKFVVFCSSCSNAATTTAVASSMGICSVAPAARS